jgi:hypothetical protein
MSKRVEHLEHSSPRIHGHAMEVTETRGRRCLCKRRRWGMARARGSHHCLHIPPRLSNMFSDIFTALTWGRSLAHGTMVRGFEAPQFSWTQQWEPFVLLWIHTALLLRTLHSLRWNSRLSSLLGMYSCVRLNDDEHYDTWVGTQSVSLHHRSSNSHDHIKWNYAILSTMHEDHLYCHLVMKWHLNISWHPYYILVHISIMV